MYKILTIGNFGSGWDGSQCDEEHIAKALENLGHQVTRMQREQVIPFTEKYDFVLIAQWNNYPANMMTTLKTSTLGAPNVYWAFDYQDEGQEWHERLVAQSDLYLSKPFKDSKYPNWRWLSQDFAPEFLDPSYDWQTVEYSKKPEKDIDVLFTGSWVPWESGKQRVEVLKAIDAKFNLQINSVTPDQWKAEGFKNVQGPVMDHQLPALIARAKINFSMDHVISPGYWSDRNSQIICCGGFVLFKYVPFSEATFGDDIAYFYDTEDCLRKIEYYLQHPIEAEIIGQRAQIQSTRRKVEHRVKQLLTIVGDIL